ncbi:MAG: methyltransferase domain-containing protein [Candidatus Hadarchaeales archaeon]
MEKKREIVRLYDETAEKYDARYAEIQRGKLRYLQRYLPKKISRLLDVGCGTGLLLAELEERAEEAYGVDLSSEMLKVARKRCRKSKLLVADAENLPFEDGFFDCIVSFTLLQNLPNPPAAVKEMARVLKKGGTAIITSLKHKHSPEDLRRWAMDAGLTVVVYGEMEGMEDSFCVGVK